MRYGNVGDPIEDIAAPHAMTYDDLKEAYKTMGEGRGYAAKKQAIADYKLSRDVARDQSVMDSFSISATPMRQVAYTAQIDSLQRQVDELKFLLKKFNVIPLEGV